MLQNLFPAFQLNQTAAVEGIKALQGNLGLVAGGIALLIVAFLIFYILKNFIANMIFGIVALLVIVYAFGVPIPLTPLVILVSVLGGLGGVGALLIATYLGWL
jgi:hypothetical protein